eukprot:GHVT01070511.1.p1 GENE.GHVT01070511.1~~GHVT01070511.1.p1  ORF type:complete len:192 (+),score=1.10 GHVT01070511.1:522-1097(+)
MVRSEATDTMLRKRDVTVRIPFVFGTYAFRLNPTEQKGSGGMTHRWVALLRSPKGDDLSYFISYIVIELDPSFLNPKRKLTIPPYLVQEAGWGEFLLTLRIHFVDDSLEPVRCTHYLKLTPDSDAEEDCVVRETHDEIILQDPHEWFYNKLVAGAYNKTQHPELERYFTSRESAEKNHLVLYTQAQSYIQV